MYFFWQSIFLVDYMKKKKIYRQKILRSLIK